MTRPLLILALAALSLPALAQSGPIAPGGRRAESRRAAQSGVASYYAASLHGNRTANGERYNHSALTVAHRSLPFGTLLRVTSVHNGRRVLVRVNDRGPFHGDRVIDVSRAAADAIGLTRAGTAEVELERLPRTGGARG